MPHGRGRVARTLAMVVLTMALADGYRGTVSATPARQAPSATRTIVAFGDSLTSGHGLPLEQAFPAVLERRLHAQGLPFRVVNHGVSGDTTSDGVRRLKAALAERPEILILALGANDGVRGVPVATVRSNLEAIIEAAQTANVKVLLCGMEALPLHGLEYTIEFHRLYDELSAKYDTPLVPFMLAGVIGNQDMLQPDLVHPNAAGAAKIAGNIWPYLQPLAAGAAGQMVSASR
jgi:acyl-CoA thioesterase I